MANQLVACVVDAQLECLRRAGQVVVEHGAVRGIVRDGLLGRDGSARKGIVVDAYRPLRLVQKRGGGLRALRGLSQRRDVVENPEGAPVGGDHEIIAVHGQIAHRSDGKIQLQRLPVVALVEGDFDAKLGAGVEELLLLRVFAHCQDELGRFEPRRDGIPALAIVARAIDIGGAVIEAMPLDRGVGDGGIEVRGFDEGDLAPGLNARRRHPNPSSCRRRGSGK